MTTKYTPGPLYAGETYSTHNHPTRYWQTPVLTERREIVAYACGATEDEARENAARHVRCVNSFDDLKAACEWAAKSCHHPACPIATGKDQRTITRDGCTCHVKAASEALAKATLIKDEAAVQRLLDAGYTAEEIEAAANKLAGS